MFVRWQSRKRGSPAFGSATRLRGRVVRTDTRKLDVHWAAILVEASRVNGKPKQEHVAYLGGITESAITILAQRCFFWDDVTERLDQLGNRMSTDERVCVESAIAERVPLPTTRADELRCCAPIYVIDARIRISGSLLTLILP